MSTPWRLVVLALLAVGLSLPGASSPFASAGPPDPLRDLGAVGGGSYALAVAGNTAMIGEGTNLILVDNSDPRRPTVMARLPLPGHPLRIRSEGHLAFVQTATYADGSGQGLALVDIRDVGHPAVRAVYATPNMPAVAGAMVYIPAFDGLHIIDATDPSQPAEIGVYATWTDLTHAAMLGDTLAVTDRSRLVILDVQEPAQPAVLGRISPLASITDLQIVGTLAYVVGGQQLAVVDLSIPSAPVLRSTVGLPAYARAVTVVGTMAYVTASRDLSPLTQPDTIQIVDVSAPAAPLLRGSYQAPREIRAVRVVGETAFVAAGVGGLQVVDVGRPEAPALLAGYEPGPVNDLAVAGGLAYLAVDDMGLEIVDVASPARPARHGLLSLIGSVHTVLAAGGLALAVDGRSLWVLDMARPDTPRVVEWSSRNEYVQAIVTPWLEVRGSLAYVGFMASLPGAEAPCGRWYALRVIDRAAAPYPRVIGGADTLPMMPGLCGSYVRFALVGDLVLAANGTGEVIVFNVSRPGQPQLAGAFYVGQGVRELQAEGGRAYLLLGDATVSIMAPDASGQMKQLGAYTAGARVGGVRVAGGMLYLSTDSRFAIVDVRDPAAPALLGSYETGPASERIAVRGGRAYLSRYTYVAFAGWGHVLTVLDIGDPTRPALLQGGGLVARGDLEFGARFVAFANGPRVPSPAAAGALSVHRLPYAPGGHIAARALSSPPADIALDGQRIYVAGGRGGLRTYELADQIYLPLGAR